MTLRRSTAAALIWVALCFLGTSYSRSETLYDLIIGASVENTSDFGGLDDPVIGFSASFPDQVLAVNFLFYPESDFDEFGSRASVEMYELSLGARYFFGEDGESFRPYGGGGVAMVHASSSFDIVGFSPVSDDDTTSGLYLDGGVRWSINRRFDVGLFARGLFAGGLELRTGVPGMRLTDGTRWHAGIMIGGKF